MARSLSSLAILATALLLPSLPAFAGITADQTMERLKALSGTWKGTPEGHGSEAEEEAKEAQVVVHEFQVSAAGTVVMETMNPGTDHEMINMYHLDGDDLVLTHYCAGGNQPTMRLDREKSTGETLIFAFDGGTNLDPAVDPHIHSAEITFVGDDKLESEWMSHAGGEAAGIMVFHLSRTE